MVTAADVAPPAQRSAHARTSAAAEVTDPLRTAGYVLVLLAVALVTCNAFRAGENVAYGDIPLALATVLLAGSWLRSGIPRGVVPAAIPLGALLLLAAGALALIPADSLGSLLPTLRFGVTLGLMPLVIMLAASTPRRVRTIVDVWLAAAALNSVVALSDVVGMTSIGFSLISVDFVTFTERAPGLTNHPNHLGLVVAMALPVAVARLGGGGGRALAALFLVPLLGAGVFASGSRGAFVAAAAGVVILFAFGAATRRLRTTLLLFGAPVLTFVVVVVLLGTNELSNSVTIERLGGGGGATVSDNARLVTLRESLDEATSSPLVGHGFEEVRTAHNIYVQLLQAGGLLALAGFAAFAAGVVRTARRLALDASGSPTWVMTLAAGCGASVGVWLLFGMVGNAIYDRYLYIPVGVILALALVHRVWCSEPEAAVASDAFDASSPRGASGRSRGERSTRRVLAP